jgi:glycosyltransferase involved in cell wall biosynthesis
MIVLALICLVCALIPCVLFLCNLREYRPPQLDPTRSELSAVSVLIPVRNEEANIARAIESVLANQGVELELVVLDDHSTDRTAAIVQEFTCKDSRARLETSPPLPQGWCGKQHACAALAERARFSLLVFMDADVRLESDALMRMTSFMSRENVALASGVPRQIVGAFWEKLLIPLIHFVLLGFLPMRRMRRCTDPAYAAGCGQLFIARAEEYRACGGHGAIRSSLHDGIKLPRAFRQHEFKTDLFDATSFASCRMYRSAREVFSGLSKNAVEGLAAPARILPITALLSAGQVISWLLLIAPGLDGVTRSIAAAACAGALLPRIVATQRFCQSTLFALLHPFGIMALLAIQWIALARHFIGRHETWRDRTYARSAAAAILVATTIAVFSAEPSDTHLKNFTLNDQFEARHAISFPRTKISFIVVADRKGSEQLDRWIRPVYARFRQRVAVAGVADLSKVPKGLRGLVRRAFVKELDYPVMLDWDGSVVRQFSPMENRANVFVVSTNGRTLRSWNGPADPAKLNELLRELETQTAGKE